MNRRQDNMDVSRKRRKLGASERWFRRRRGGANEKEDKDEGWRQKTPTPAPTPVDTTASTPSHVPGTRRPATDSGPAPPPGPVTVPAVDLATVPVPVHERDVESTLMIPFTAGSTLLKAMQKAEDEYCSATQCKRIRVIERGGSKLVHLLGRNDPWASQKTCRDPACVTCTSRTWLKEKAKEARKRKEELPPGLLRSGSHACRREGVNYSLQCLTCLSIGCRTLYRGESSRSSRQRHGEHWRDLEAGVVTSPMVLHAIQEHGGDET